MFSCDLQLFPLWMKVLTCNAMWPKLLSPFHNHMSLLTSSLDSRFSFNVTISMLLSYRLWQSTTSSSSLLHSDRAFITPGLTSTIHFCLLDSTYISTTNCFSINRMCSSITPNYHRKQPSQHHALELMTTRHIVA